VWRSRTCSGNVEPSKLAVTAAVDEATEPSVVLVPVSLAAA